jgi:hypothetical protein
MMMMTYLMKSKTGHMRRVRGKMEMFALVCDGWTVEKHDWI